MRNILVRFGLWLAHFGGWLPTIVAESDPVMLFVPRTRELCLEQELHAPAGSSGEYKRHQVYARLIKEFPQAHKRDLALAIELALR